MSRPIDRINTADEAGLALNIAAYGAEGGIGDHNSGLTGGEVRRLRKLYDAFQDRFPWSFKRNMHERVQSGRIDVGTMRRIAPHEYWDRWGRPDHHDLARDFSSPGEAASAIVLAAYVVEEAGLHHEEVGRLRRIVDKFENQFPHEFPRELRRLVRNGDLDRETARRIAPNIIRRW